MASAPERRPRVLRRALSSFSEGPKGPVLTGAGVVARPTRLLRADQGFRRVWDAADSGRVILVRSRQEKP